MGLEGKRPQMSRQLELAFKSRGEAPRVERSEEEPAAARGDERSGASDLMEKVVSRPNLQAALKRVRILSATSTSWGFPGSPRDLNLSNRPVRTRMPGGVAGELFDPHGLLCLLCSKSRTYFKNSKPNLS